MVWPAQSETAAIVSIGNNTSFGRSLPILSQWCLENVSTSRSSLVTKRHSQSSGTRDRTRNNLVYIRISTARVEKVRQRTKIAMTKRR